MTPLIAVALGGALGALGRYGVNHLASSLLATRFPLGTLAINVLGSMLIGVLYVLIVEKAVLPMEWRNLLMTGFVGALTTFSTFSLDAVALWQNGHLFLALGYIASSVVLCLLGTAGAMYLTRLI